MKVTNLTSKSLNALDPEGFNISLKANSATDGMLANPSVIKTLVTMFTPEQIKIKLIGEEMDVLSKLGTDITNWLD